MIVMLAKWHCRWEQFAADKVLTNVLVELSHEGLAEACDLGDGASLGVEVRASLSSSHGKCRQAVLENLLKTQKLDDAETHAGSKSQTTLKEA